MAKHESEMHRQRRIALEGLRAIATLAPHNAGLAMRIAQQTIDGICEPAANGLWADRRQMDLADRKDC